MATETKNELRAAIDAAFAGLAELESMGWTNAECSGEHRRTIGDFDISVRTIHRDHDYRVLIFVRGTDTVAANLHLFDTLDAAKSVASVMVAGMTPRLS